MEFDVGKLELMPKTIECLEALAETGAFGNTIQEVIARFLQDKVFRLDDVKAPTIWGLLKRGKEDDWIVSNVPDTQRRNKQTLSAVKRDSDAYPL